MMHREITFFLLHQAPPSSATVAAFCGLTSHIFQNLAEPVEPSPGEQNEVIQTHGMPAPRKTSEERLSAKA